MSDSKLMMASVSCWIILALCLLGAIPWAPGITALVVLLTVTTSIHLYGPRPLTATEVFRRRRDNYALVAGRLYGLKLSLRSARNHLMERCATTDLPECVRSQAAQLVASSRNEVSRLEGRVAQTEQDYNIARTKLNESMDDMNTLARMREEAVYVQQGKLVRAG